MTRPLLSIASWSIMAETLLGITIIYTVIRCKNTRSTEVNPQSATSTSIQ